PAPPRKARRLTAESGSCLSSIFDMSRSSLTCDHRMDERSDRLNGRFVKAVPQDQIAPALCKAVRILTSWAFDVEGMGRRGTPADRPCISWQHFTLAGRLSSKIAFQIGRSFSWMASACLLSPAWTASQSWTQSAGTAVRIAAIAPCAPSANDGYRSASTAVMMRASFPTILEGDVRLARTVQGGPRAVNRARATRSMTVGLSCHQTYG